MPGDAVLAAHGLLRPIYSAVAYPPPVRVEPTGTAGLIITAAEAIAHAGEGISTQQATNFDIWVQSATDMILAATRRSGLTQTFACYWDEEGLVGLSLPRPPFINLTSLASVYEGTETALATSKVFTGYLGSRQVVRLKSGNTWPTPWDLLRVTFTAGYHADDETKVPAPMRHAALICTDYAFQYGVLPAGIPDEAMAMLKRAHLIVPS